MGWDVMSPYCRESWLGLAEEEGKFCCCPLMKGEQEPHPAVTEWDTA